MKWLDRALFISPIYYGLCLSEAEFRAELRRLKVPRDEWPSFVCSDRADATTHILSRGNKRIAIVALSDKNKASNIQINALLVHEATHIWQEILLLVGERAPSSEFEAYAVQALSQSLMQAYEDQKRKGKR